MTRLIHLLQTILLSRQTLYTIILILALFLYLKNNDIGEFLFNYKELKGQERTDSIHELWKFRLSSYSVILALVFFAGQFKLNIFNKELMRLGLSFSLISVYDKFILKNFNLMAYDNLIIGLVIFLSILRYIHFKNKN